MHRITREYGNNSWYCRQHFNTRSSLFSSLNPSANGKITVNKYIRNLDIACACWLMPVIPVFKRLRQEECHKFKAGLGYRIRPGNGEKSWVGGREGWNNSLGNLNKCLFLQNNCAFPCTGEHTQICIYTHQKNTPTQR